MDPTASPTPAREAAVVADAYRGLLLRVKRAARLNTIWYTFYSGVDWGGNSRTPTYADLRRSSSFNRIVGSPSVVENGTAFGGAPRCDSALLIHVTGILYDTVLCRITVVLAPTI